MRLHAIEHRFSRWLVPPAALAAIAGFASFETAAAAGAESAYLGRLAAAVLAAVAAVSPAPAAELGLGAALAVAAVWALPAGPGRGAAALAVLAVSLGVATVRRLRLPAPRSFAAHAAVAAALCFGWQALLRGELLFAPGRAARPWTALLVLPAVAGVALTVLWRRHAKVPALAAAAAAAVLAPGWTVATTLALVALAGGSVLAGDGGSAVSGRNTPAGGRIAAGDGAVETPAAAAPVTPGAAAVPARWMPMRRLRGNPSDRWGWLSVLRRAATLAALVLPMAWEPRAGWGAALAGLAVLRPGIALLLALPLGIAARFLPLPGLPGAWAPHAGWHEALLGLAWLAVLVPAVLAVLAAGARRTAQLDASAGRAAVMAAAALLAFATPWLPDRTAAAAPIALAALALPAEGAAAGLSALWSGALLAGTALLASYPWLRRDPLGDVVGLLTGGAAGAERVAAIASLAALLLIYGATLVARRGGRRSEQARLGAWAAGAALLAALLAPPWVRPATALLGPGATVLLDGGHPSWQAEVTAPSVRSVVVESTMVNAAALAPGAPVARVRLLATAESPVEVVLRTGSDTGDWAAGRPDLAARGTGHAPAPWLSWVAGGFFGQRYRQRLALPRGGSFARLRIDLASGLPPGAGLAVYQLVLEP